MSKLKYLSKNLALFTVSNFVSKILVFLLVPLYTNVLTTYEYGVCDIIQVTMLLLVPALSVNMGEAALRFGIEKKEQRQSILKIGLKYVFRAIALVGIFVTVSVTVTNSGVFNLSFSDKNICSYLWVFALIFAANSIFEFLILYFQGCERVEIVVIGSVLSTLTTILLNILFLLVFKFGIYGYLFSQVAAFTVASLVMMGLSGAFKNASENEEAETESCENVVGCETGKNGKTVGCETEKNEKIVESNLEKEMLDYGKPLIAYSTASWINNAVDRYFVAGLCGAAVNGIYGVAYKIPAILMVFQRIFAQAWQMSASKSYKDKNSADFFENMYKVYNTFMVLGCGFLILFVKIVAGFLFRKDFYIAYKCVPPLLISVIFGALTGFIGSICLAHKDSKSMGLATSAGAIVNIVLNFVLIRKIGAEGAAIATMISYFVMFFLSLRLLRKHVTIRINFVRDLLAYICLVAMYYVITTFSGNEYVICGIILCCVIVIYIKEVIELFKTFAGYLKRRN